MAQLPDSQALGERPEPVLPRRTPQIASYRATTGMEDFTSQTLAHEGAEFENAASNFLKAQEYHDTLRAEDAFTQLRQKQIDLTYGDGGFANLKGGDAVNKPILKTYKAQFDQVANQLSGSLDNGFQQKLFQKRVDVAGLQLQEDIVKHVASQANVYSDDVLKGTLDTEVQNAASRWSEPDAALLPIQRINSAIDLYASRNGKPAEWATDLREKATSKVYDGIIRQALATDPDQAQAMFTVYGKNLQAADRSQLDMTIQNHQYTAMVRDTMQEQRAQAAAQKELHLDQAKQFADMWASVLKPGKNNPAPTAGDIADAVRNQQLTPEMGHALLTMEKGGEDNSQAVIGLHVLLHDENATTKDKLNAISRAASGRQITALTAGTLTDGVFNKDTKGETAEQKGLYASLKTILGGHNVEMGLIHLDNTQERMQSDLWGQAQNEWTQRVLVGKEDAQTVFSNMVQRYQQKPVVPTWLPVPRYGSTTSLEDVKAVAAKTMQQFQTNGITQDEYAYQMDILNNYRNFYQQQIAQQQAAQAALKGNVGKQEKGKAKLIGVEAQ